MRSIDETFLRDVLGRCIAADFRILGVYDGEEFVSCGSPTAAIEVIDSVEESAVYLKASDGHKVALCCIPNNGAPGETVYDYTVDDDLDRIFDDILDDRRYW